MKLCGCGCGEEVKKGNRFVNTHNLKRGVGKDSPNWQGGIKRAGNRVFLYAPGHPRAYQDKYALRSILVAEKALGKPLPLSAIVHHADNNSTNDKNNNLVVCENRGYHMLLHTRERAYRSCGHAAWRKCRYCHQYDSIENLRVHSSSVVHKQCQKDYCKAWYRKKHDPSRP